MEKRIIFCLIFVFMISGAIAEEQINVVLKYDQNVSDDLQIKNVSLREFQELKESEDISVQVNGRVRLSLTESSVLINATRTHSLISDLNLTGENEGVCVIDTGISSHSDLPNILAQKCYCGNSSNYNLPTGCCPNGLNEDSVATDDHGHGTHVSGIVAANGNLKGISNGAGIVALKVLDSTGSGWDADVIKAIDWCVANKDEYNISVISLSLGGGLYSSACDASQAAYSSSINSAVVSNISVVVATGNEGNYTRIASPACIENAIAVADSYDADVNGISWGSPVICTDSSTFADKIVCHANRNSLVKLLAPGALINSTWLSNGYHVTGGTSMATPHVSGAIAIINQYLRSVGRSKTPSEIEQVLFDSGKKINDSGKSNINYSRINVYSAIISLDEDAPVINLSSPENNSVSSSRLQEFNCSISDLSLKNVTFNLWNSSEKVNETSYTVSGASYNLSLSLDLGQDRYNWSCSGYDEHGNFASSGNYSLEIGGIEVVQNYPDNNTYTKVNETFFNCSTSSQEDLKNVTFNLWNSSWEYNETKEISGLENSSEFNYTFIGDGEYFWNCKVVGNETSKYSDNFSLVYDSSVPVINLFSIPSDETSNSVSKVFEFNVSEDSSCSLVINDIVNETKNIIANINSNFTKTFSSGVYNWKINCSDLAGNSNLSEQKTLTITAVQQNTGGGSRGGGGGGGASIAASLVAPAEYVLTTQEASSGQARQLKKQDKVKFVLYDEKAEEHSVSVENVSNNSVVLIVKSEPITVVLALGQSRKMNLTSEQYYDLYLKLESINNSQVSLVIQTIHEPINPERNVEAQSIPIVVSKQINWKMIFGIFISALILLAVLFFIFDRIERNKIKKELLWEMRKIKHGNKA